MKILLTAFGSLGDLHPYIALATALLERGHVAAIATNSRYRDKIESEGIGFHAIGPDYSAHGALKNWAPKASHPRTGTFYIINRMILPHINTAYSDLKAAAAGYDAIIGHPLTYAARIVCEEIKIPWISVMLYPLTLYSTFSPPILPYVPLSHQTNGLSPRFHRAQYEIIRKATRVYAEPIQQLRKRAGLGRSSQHPLYDGLYSPTLNLCLFSPLFACEQPDWPESSRATGFLFHDRSAKNGALGKELDQFLNEGPPPIVFTLGSFVSAAPGLFFSESAKAAQKLGYRAVIIVGGGFNLQDQKKVPDGVRFFAYAPFSELFPRAVAVVHQGGIGTTALAIRAKLPQVIVPYVHDQPDNAVRTERLGISLSISRTRYNAFTAAHALSTVLSKQSYSMRASELGDQIALEDGPGNACRAIEDALASSPKSV